MNSYSLAVFVLVALFNLTSTSWASKVEEKNIREYYSDEPPAHSFIGHTKQPFSKILEERGFQKIRGMEYGDALYVRIKNPINFQNPQFDSAIFLSQQLFEGEKLLTKNRKLTINGLVFSERRWDFERPTFNHVGEDYLNTLSWRYVHDQVNFRPMITRGPFEYCAFPEENSFFRSIKENGIQNTILRVCQSNQEKGNLFSIYLSSDVHSNAHKNSFDKEFIDGLIAPYRVISSYIVLDDDMEHFGCGGCFHF